MDMMAKLGERMVVMEATLESLKTGEDLTGQQAALREKILDRVKSTAVETLSHSFSQHAAQLHARMTTLHEDLIARLETGMKDAEVRLQSRLVDLADKPANVASSSGARVDSAAELHQLLQTERQDRNDLAEKQSDVLHGIIQEFSTYKEQADARREEIEHLRGELHASRACEARHVSRLQQAVDALSISELALLSSELLLLLEPLLELPFDFLPDLSAPMNLPTDFHLLLGLLLGSMLVFSVELELALLSSKLVLLVSSLLDSPLDSPRMWRHALRQLGRQRSGR